MVIGLEGARGSLLERVAAWLGHLGRLRPHEVREDAASDTELLDRRASQLAVALDGLGWNPTRLGTSEIERLFGSAWGSQRARRQTGRYEQADRVT